MERATFGNYIRREVIPAMTAEKNVIFLDTHDSHILDDDFVEECLVSDKDITVVIVPAGQTDRLQPMNMKAFGPVEKYWLEFMCLLPLPLSEAVSEQKFAQHLMEKWHEHNMALHLQSGFEAAGIYPFNTEKVCQRTLAMEKKPKKPEAAPPKSTPSVERVMKILAADIDRGF